MRLEIERTTREGVGVSTASFIRLLDADMKMFGAENLYKDIASAMEHLHFLVDRHNEAIAIKNKKKNLPFIKFGRGSSHIWICDTESDDRIAVIYE